MKCKLAIIACMLVSGCVSNMPVEKDQKLVRISVEASAKTKFESRLAAAEPLAVQACAKQEKQAKWVVSERASDTRTVISFMCW